MPEAILIAGPNGAGKTTLASFLVPEFPKEVLFLNADEVQQAAETTAFGAGRELLRLLAKAEAAQESFAVETTLSTRLYAPKIRRWRQRGYWVSIHFIELPSPDFAVRRVARRVRSGGHGIPEVDVRRRFDRGLNLFHSLYKPLVDEWYHWLSDDEGVRLVQCHQAREP